MSAHHVNPPATACPPDLDALCQQIPQRLDEIIAFCLHRDRGAVEPSRRPEQPGSGGQSSGADRSGRAGSEVAAVCGHGTGSADESRE